MLSGTVVLSCTDPVLLARVSAFRGNLFAGGGDRICFSYTVFTAPRNGSHLISIFPGRVWRGSEGCCCVAQIVARRLAVRQARVQISAWHPKGGPLPSGSYEDNRMIYILYIYKKYCMYAGSRIMCIWIPRNSYWPITSRNLSYIGWFTVLKMPVRYFH